MKITADTNVLVRALTGDDARQSKVAQAELAGDEEQSAIGQHDGVGHATIGELQRVRLKPIPAEAKPLAA